MLKKLLLILATVFILSGCNYADSGYLLMYNGYPYPGNMLFEYQGTTIFTLANHNPSIGIYFPGGRINQLCPNNSSCVVNIFLDFQHRFLGSFTINTITSKVVDTNSQDPNLKFYNLYYLCYYSSTTPCVDEKKTR